MRDLRHLLKPSQPRLASDEQGLAILFWALMLPFILLFFALVADTGLATVEKRELQNAVDAAALAGAQELPDADAAEAVAERFVEANLGTDPSDLTIAVTTPYDGDPTLIEVTVTGPTVKLLGGDYALGPETVSARAVARASNNYGAGYTFLVLSETACSAFTKSGSSNLIINGGAVMVNSDCNGGPNSRAVVRSGAGDVITAANDHFDQGGFKDSGSGEFLPALSTVPTIVPDPLAGLMPPVVTEAAASVDSGGGPANPATLLVGEAPLTILRPGVYFGGIKIHLTGDVTMEPGVYVMAGGGFGRSGSGSLTAAGVTIYNTSDPFGDPELEGAAVIECRVIDIRGSGATNISGPASGAYRDIAFWQDPACDEPMSLEGGEGVTSGVIYLPNAEFQLSGSGGLGPVQVVSDTVKITGTGDLTIDAVDYIGYGTGLQVALVE